MGPGARVVPNPNHFRLLLAELFKVKHSRLDYYLLAPPVTSSKYHSSHLLFPSRFHQLYIIHFYSLIGQGNLCSQRISVLLDN